MNILAKAPLAESARRLVAWLRMPYHWLSVLFLVVFGYLIIVPVLQLVLDTLQIQEGDVRRAGGAAGQWTLYYWDRTFNSHLSEALLYRPLRNTLTVSFFYTLLAMTIGMAMAWLLVKTDLPLKRFIGVVSLVPYIVPSWTIALSWLTLFANDRVGIGAPGILQNLTGWVPPDWVAYGPFPIIVVLAVNYYAFTFLLVAAALSTLDGRLEESASLHGASSGMIARRISLPIVFPAIGSAFILTFAEGIGSFGAPAFLGIPVRYDMLATSLYQSAGLGRFADAFVLTILLIVMAGVTIVMNTMLLGRRRQFTTMTGKGSTQLKLSLGIWRWPVTGLALMDEPLSNLDAKLRIDMRVELKELHEQTGRTIIYVTHDQSEALTLSTRLMVMDRGVVQQLGTPDAVFMQPANRFTASFMGSASLNEFTGTMNGEGLQMDCFRLPLPTWLPPDPELRAIILAMRPDELTLSRQPGPWCVPGHVISVLPMGYRALAHIALDTGVGESSVTVEFSRRDWEVTARQLVHVQFNPETLHLFDGESESRISLAAG